VAAALALLLLACVLSVVAGWVHPPKRLESRQGAIRLIALGTVVATLALGVVTFSPEGDTSSSSSLNQPPLTTVAPPVTPSSAKEQIAVPQEAASYLPTEPLLILDTRTSTEKDSALKAGETRQIHLGALPPHTVAASVDISFVGPPAAGGFRIWAADQVQPEATQLYATPGHTLATSAITRLSPAGDVKVQSDAGGDLVIYATGYWIPARSSRTGRFVPTISRLYDSRTNDNSTGTAVLLPKLAPGTTITISFRSPYVTLPTEGISAVVLRVAAIEADSPGYATLWPSDSRQPVVANLTYGPGEVITSTVITPLGADENISLYTSAAAHYVVETMGWFTDTSAPDDSSGLFVPTASIPIADTTQGVPRDRLRANERTDVDVSRSANIPTGASAVLVELTAVDPEEPGYATVWPTDGPRPVSFALTYATQSRSSGLSLVELGGRGQVSVFFWKASDFRIQLLGWFI
jgi:hypothetical protein